MTESLCIRHHQCFNDWALVTIETDAGLCQTHMHGLNFSELRALVAMLCTLQPVIRCNLTHKIILFYHWLVEIRHRRRVLARVVANRSCFDNIRCTALQTGPSTNINTIINTNITVHSRTFLLLHSRTLLGLAEHKLEEIRGYNPYSFVDDWNNKQEDIYMTYLTRWQDHKCKTFFYVLSWKGVFNVLFSYRFFRANTDHAVMHGVVFSVIFELIWKILQTTFLFNVLTFLIFR